MLRTDVCIVCSHNDSCGKGYVVHITDVYGEDMTVDLVGSLCLQAVKRADTQEQQQAASNTNRNGNVNENINPVQADDQDF
jgi:hypothetical protein